MTAARPEAVFFMDDPATLDDPFADLERYRRSRPVYYHEPLEQWFIFRYDDVAALFRDPRLSADRMKGFVDQAPEPVRGDLRRIAPALESWLLMQDGAEHARLRKALNLGFNATAVENLRPAIERAANDLLDRVQETGRIDVAADYGFLLPAYVLCAFLGVHEQDRDQVVRWSVDFVDFFNIFPITVDTATRMVRSTDEMTAYTQDLLAARRAQPSEDFLSVLLQGSDGEGGLSEREIVGNAMLLLLAGHVAVRNLIGNAVWLLLTHPAQAQKLREAPELLHDAIDETLRFEPPVTLIPRIALEDIECGGQLIRKGQVVQLSIVSANRDAAHFPDPDRFDITRRPARLLSFGHGPHGCLGAHLARLETAIALQTLFSRMPGLRLDERGTIRWYRTAANRGPINLPLLFDRA